MDHLEERGYRLLIEDPSNLASSNLDFRRNALKGYERSQEIGWSGWLDRGPAKQQYPKRKQCYEGGNIVLCLQSSRQSIKSTDQAVLPIVWKSGGYLHWWQKRSFRFDI